MSPLLLLPLAFSMPQTPVYSELLRPQFHFTAEKGWLNDPNGLVYFKGEYHLFFQHNPLGTQWGNMTWGHAVSKDLVHWKQLPNAIEPDGLGTIFSGSAVVDARNTSGFGSAKELALVCIYTAAGGTNEDSKGQPFTQCLAYSTDGRTFTKFAGNPVLKHIEAENRDPKVLWDEAGKRWVMALYLNGDRYALFASPDLKSWERTGDVAMPGSSECPDFFPLRVGNSEGPVRWVFWGANGRYRLGSFDGKTFVPETEPLPTQFGNTGYAAQTFFNDPKGRRVQIAWHNNANFPDCAWNQEMGVPTELRLVSMASGPRLTIQPVEEIETLRVKRFKHEPSGWYPVGSGLIDAAFKFKVGESGTCKLTVNGTEIGFDGATHELKCLDKTVKIDPEDGAFRIRLLADRASVELFVQGGLATMPIFRLPIANAQNGLKLELPAGWQLLRSEVYELKSAWRP